MKIKNLCFAALAAYALAQTNITYSALAPDLTKQDYIIPKEKEGKIQNFFNEYSLKKPLLKKTSFFNDSKKIPNMSINTTDEIPILKINSAAASVYNGILTSFTEEQKTLIILFLLVQHKNLFC